MAAMSEADVSEAAVSEAAWVAPTVERPSVPHVADERTMLEAWLDHHRATLVWKCAGLTGEQLCERSATPSTMSLLGLVRHMAEVERGWFRRFRGEADLPLLYCAPDNEDGDFDDTDPAGAAADFATFESECALAREAVAAASLDDTYRSERRGIDISLRWVFSHMIEEYARHNGHADLLRERTDGTTGD
jgi:uncharacterized damage-inducible protein DinB